MKGQMSTKYGKVLIDTDAIATYAGSIVVECFGIVGMASLNVADGFVRLLKKDSLKDGIRVSCENNRLKLEFHVIVAYGVSISAVADTLIGSVKYRVEEFTGLEVEKIKILVEGVRYID